jgi:hypothetical protein
MRLPATFTRLAILLALAVAGCAQPASRQLTGIPNQPPSVELSADLLSSGGSGAASFRASWIGSDPDGVVDHYLVTREFAALGQESRGWLRSDVRSDVLTGRRAERLAAGRPLTREPDVFAVRAVDNRGAASLPAAVAVFEDNIAPTVQIVSPKPSILSRAYLPPSFLVRWEGTDPDGHARHRPIRYKYRIIGRDDPDISINLVRIFPDSLRRLFAPHFVGWTTVPGVFTSVEVKGLTIGEEYVFAIVAIDERGDYSPVFSFDTNLLYLRVVPGNALSPAGMDLMLEPARAVPSR